MEGFDLIDVVILYSGSFSYFRISPEMSSLRQRHTKSNTSNRAVGEKPSVVNSVSDSILKVILRGKSGKNVKSIEEMSVVPYIIAFVLFLTFSIYFVDYIHHLNEDHVIASHSEMYTRLFKQIKCSRDYGEKFKKCLPKKCGRVIQDHLFEKRDILYLKELAIHGMQHGGGSGGATILDLHSGALSYKDKFVDIYKLKRTVFNKTDFDIYSKIKAIIQNAIASKFEIPKEKLYLTKPTFFSRLTNASAVTKHDEYWHKHIDRETYGTFYYTSLLYLSEYEVDFTGGRFMFDDVGFEKIVEPRLGRLSYFTSGSENQHHVERVETGVRYAITVSFTCDKKHAISDPK